MPYRSVYNTLNYNEELSMINFLIGLAIGTIPGAVVMFLWMEKIHK